MEIGTELLHLVMIQSLINFHVYFSYHTENISLEFPLSGTLKNVYHSKIGSPVFPILCFPWRLIFIFYVK